MEVRAVLTYRPLVLAVVTFRHTASVFQPPSCVQPLDAWAVPGAIASASAAGASTASSARRAVRVMRCIVLLLQTTGTDARRDPCPAERRGSLEASPRRSKGNPRAWRADAPETGPLTRRGAAAQDERRALTPHGRTCARSTRAKTARLRARRRARRPGARRARSRPGTRTRAVAARARPSRRHTPPTRPSAAPKPFRR